MNAAGVRSRRRRTMADINVVPYIDVMLVLLIIFMITAPMLQTGVEVEMPQAAAKPLAGEDELPVVVTVDREGALYVNVGGGSDEAVDAEVLQARIAAILRNKPGTRVLVKGDKSAPYQYVVNAMALVQQAGVEKVGLMTDPEGE